MELGLDRTTRLPVGHGEFSVGAFVLRDSFGGSIDYSQRFTEKWSAFAQAQGRYETQTKAWNAWAVGGIRCIF